MIWQERLRPYGSHCAQKPGLDPSIGTTGCNQVFKSVEGLPNCQILSSYTLVCLILDRQFACQVCRRCGSTSC